MTGLSFSLPGLEQVSDPRQLRACLLRLSEELRYALSHISGENFSEETRRRLSQMEKDARTAGELARQNGDQARQEFRRVYVSRCMSNWYSRRKSCPAGSPSYCRSRNPGFWHR